MLAASWSGALLSRLRPFTLDAVRAGNVRCNHPPAALANANVFLTPFKTPFLQRNSLPPNISQNVIR